MSLGDDERKENIKTYYFRAKEKYVGLNDGFDKQFYADGLKDVWHSFDAFLGLNFPAQDNKQMQIKLAAKYQPIFEKWRKSDMFMDSVKRLRVFGKLLDMKPVKSKPPIDIADIQNLLEILQFSFRVRSNLNHGSKDLESESEKARTNRSLVEYSFKVTYEILENVLIEEKVI